MKQSIKKPKLEKWWVQTKGRPLTRKGLVKKVDTAFSLFIRARDKKCVTCPATTKLQCGHLFSRVSFSTRWDELNCHTQCEGCNMSHEYDPQPFTSWFIHKFGLEAYDELHAKSKKTAKELKCFKDRDLADLLKIYQEKLMASE